MIPSSFWGVDVHEAQFVLPHTLAVSVPLPFDVVWTQHVAMNIPDKATMYREVHRVLKPAGVLAIYDILAGPAGEVLFPVPWARLPETSCLATPDQLRQLLEETGFEISSWEDTTPAAQEWFASLAGSIRLSGLPPLGFHVLLGPDFHVMAQNQRRNLEEGRIVLGQVVARKQASAAAETSLATLSRESESTLNLFGSSS